MASVAVVAAGAWASGAAVQGARSYDATSLRGLDVIRDPSLNHSIGPSTQINALMSKSSARFRRSERRRSIATADTSCRRSPVRGHRATRAAPNALTARSYNSA